jgi:hypothetical protein
MGAALRPKDEADRRASVISSLIILAILAILYYYFT